MYRVTVAGAGFRFLKSARFAGWRRTRLCGFHVRRLRGWRRPKLCSLRCLEPRQRRHPVAHGAAVGSEWPPDLSSVPAGAASGTSEAGLEPPTREPSGESWSRARSSSGSEAGRCRPYGAGETYGGTPVSPRLRRGLHDHARSAGFWMGTPGAQPKIGDMLIPDGV